MIKGIGAIPHNLIIKSGGYTYYPLNQFEIDGTVSVDLYRQDSEGNKIKMFSFKGVTGELSQFKKRYANHVSTNYPNSGWNDKAKKDWNIQANKTVYKLAENLHSEAATFNKKIKTGAKLSLNESIAAGKKMLLKTNEIKYTDKPANKIVVGDYVSLGDGSHFKVVYIKELLNGYLEIKGSNFNDRLKVKNNRIITTYTKKRDHSIQDIKPKSIQTIKPMAPKKSTPKPAVKKLFTLSQYKKNEDINHHIENSLQLTERFGTKAEKEEMRKLVDKNKNRQISNDDYNRMYIISGKYYKLLLPKPKKTPTPKKTTAKKYGQTGSTNTKYDKLVQAKAPGKRVSKTGRKYTETRANRSDKGKWL